MINEKEWSALLQERGMAWRLLLTLVIVDAMFVGFRVPAMMKYSVVVALFMNLIWVFWVNNKIKKILKAENESRQIVG